MLQTAANPPAIQGMSTFSSDTLRRLARRRGRFSLALGLLLCVGPPVWASQVRIVLPDRTTSIPIETVNRLPYVDARPVADAVSGRIRVDRARGQVSLQVGARTIALHIGRSQVQIGEQVLSMSSAPLFQGHRVLVPVDVIPLVLAERHGQLAVEWQPKERVAQVRPPEITITQIRTGTSPTQTRIVLDTAGPLEWTLQTEDGGDGVRVLVPGGVLAPTIRPLTLRNGLVRAVQPTQHASGAEVRILRVRRDTGLRTFTLRNPDRIVIDVLPPSRRSAAVHANPSGETTVAPAPAPAPVPTGQTPVPRPPPPPEAVSEAPSRPSATRSPAADLRPDSAKPIPSGQGKASGDPHPAAPGEASGVLTVVLDPGHGGHDSGAIGPTGLKEKDVVLDLAWRLRRLLQERLGIRVIMTRTEDVFVPLQERTAIANQARADFFISIHVNGASKRGAVGFETFYFTREPSDSDARASAQRENLVIEADAARGEDQESLLRTILADMAVTRDIRESSQLAELTLTSLEKLLKVENRGVKSGPFYVLATAAMPAILVESAFITSPREERKLQREVYRQRLAEAMFEAIARYKARYERRVGMRAGSSAAADS